MVRITLCGSTRFMEDFNRLNRELSLKGHVVYSVAFNGKDPATPITDEQKETLDKVHKAKIDNSDMIVVINRDGYVGESTDSEIKYAIEQRKLVRFVWPVPTGYCSHYDYQVTKMCHFKGCENDSLTGPCALCYE